MIGSAPGSVGATVGTYIPAALPDVAILLVIVAVPAVAAVEVVADPIAIPPPS
jgi:hypothetical protein